MALTRRRLIALAGGAAAVPILPAVAEDWPSRPVRILVGTAAGGSPDIVSRIIGEKLAERLGQSFVIENNTQGAGAVAPQLVNRPPPHGVPAPMVAASYPPQVVVPHL